MKLNYLVIPLITLGVAWLGNWLTGGGMDWYQTIKLPAWTPPGSVIGFAWTIIFILGAISALIVWNKVPHQGRFWWIIIIFLINALLNIFWSFLFFNQHLIGPAVWEAGLLGLSVLVLIILIWPLSGRAAWLLIPYGGWVTFATYLTYMVWSLNR